MDLRHRFTVPARVDEAWNAFNDLERLGPCFPGATITGVQGDEFTGSVKIKLGPIALLYAGSGQYTERNDAERRVVIEARGKDKRGNGTATATVTASFTDTGGQTEVDVLTDLVITGKPAQFGRGVIADVSDKLLDQFVGCVSEQFADRPELTQPPAERPDSEPPPEPKPATATADEAAPADLNILTTLVPVLLRRYGPVIAVFGLLLLVAIKIVRRRFL